MTALSHFMTIPLLFFHNEAVMLANLMFMILLGKSQWKFHGGFHNNKYRQFY